MKFWLGLVLAAASIFAAGYSASRYNSPMLLSGPVPLCPPEAPDCGHQ